MLKIIDKYILKRYLGTFFTMLLLFIPIGIMANLSEKVDNMIENKVPFLAIVEYYGNFTIHMGYLLFPLFLFLSVIWFTSKLANNTEIIAILSSGVSFTRFLRPYLIGSTCIAIFFFVIGMFVLPNASKKFNEFLYGQLHKGRSDREKGEVFRQLNDNEYIYASTFNSSTNSAYNFTLEHFEGNKLTHKISATKIQFRAKDSVYRLTNYVLRIIGEHDDVIVNKRRKDTIFNFELEDLTPVKYIAETLNYPDLIAFIEKEKRLGSTNVNRYEVVKYKRWSIPFSAFVLTIIAVAVSAMKRRGGMGVNLALGIALAFVFVFMDKIFSVMAEQSGLKPILAVWLPNIIFGVLAIYLLNRAKR